MAETGISLFLAVIVCMFCLLLGAACMTLGNGDAPIRIYGQAKLFQPVSTVFIQGCITGFLSILFLSLFVSVLSAFVKEETSLLITSVVLITGFGYAPYLIPYLQPFAHLFPTTYMHFSAIVNGWMSKQFYNGYLILTHGMYNLMIWCLGLSIWLSFYLLRTRIYRKDRR